MALILRPPGTRESLQEQLDELGRTRKRVAVAAGVLGFAAVVLACVSLACVLDAAFHLPPLARALVLDCFIKLRRVPFLQPLRFPGDEIGLHRKVGAGQI